MRDFFNTKHNRIFYATFVLLLSFITITAFSHTYAAEPFDSIGQYKKIQMSDEGLMKYMKEVKAKAILLQQAKMTKITSTITFSEPLTYDELAAYISSHHIDAVQIQARALLGETRISIATVYGEGFDALSKKQLEKYPGAHFVGYTDIYAKVNYSDIAGIQKDEKTFVLDSSSDEFFEGAKDKDGDKRNKHRKGNNKYAHSLTWMLEDLDEKQGNP